MVQLWPNWPVNLLVFGVLVLGCMAGLLCLDLIFLYPTLMFQRLLMRGADVCLGFHISVSLLHHVDEGQAGVGRGGSGDNRIASVQYFVLVCRRQKAGREELVSCHCLALSMRGRPSSVRACRTEIIV
jgi:hypothetical protein